MLHNIHASFLLGEFGIVYRGQLQKAVERVIQTRTVAVKTLKGIAASDYDNYDSSIHVH